MKAAGGSAGSRREDAATAALAVGFLALAAGVGAAYATPARGYELSIYRATPPAFWAGVGTALAAAVGVLALAPRDRDVSAALLGGGGVLAVVALPAVRSYYFYGQVDSLTHLGWAREIVAGQQSVTELFYPGSHVSAALIGSVAGVDLTRAVLLFVPAVAVVYVLFVALTVRVLAPGRRAGAVGAVSGALLLPLNNVSTHLMFHPYSLATLLAPLFLFLLVRHVTDYRGLTRSPRLVSPTGVALLLVGAGLLFVHSQAMLNLLLLVGAVVAVQVYYRRSHPDHPIADQRLVVGQFLLLGGLFLAWNLRHEAMFSTLDSLVAAVVGDASVGPVVAQRTGSLSAIGASLTGVFAKLFLVSTLYVLLSAALVVAVLRGGKTVEPRTESGVTYLAAGGAALVPLVVLHAFGPLSSYLFRYLGFGMVLATILGALAIHVGVPDWRGLLARTGAAVVALAVFALSLSVLFPSPFVYSPSHHVTEAGVAGYGTAMDTQAEDVPIASVRGGVRRYADALGAEDVPYDRVERVGALPLGDLPGYYPADRYFAVTETDRVREVRAYRELRYSADEFGALGTTPGVHRVETTGSFDLYYVEGEES